MEKISPKDCSHTFEKGERPTHLPDDLNKEGNPLVWYGDETSAWEYEGEDNDMGKHIFLQCYKCGMHKIIDETGSEVSPL